MNPAIAYLYSAGSVVLEALRFWIAASLLHRGPDIKFGRFRPAVFSIRVPCKTKASTAFGIFCEKVMSLHFDGISTLTPTQTMQATGTVGFALLKTFRKNGKFTERHANERTEVFHSGYHGMLNHNTQG
jgi:hypothetical protein